MLSECLFGLIAACESVCMCLCVASTVSSLGSDRNDDDSVVAMLESSHVLSGETGPLILINQSHRGCWEQDVLGNDLAGGLRSGEGREEHIEGADKWGGEEGSVQRVQGGWRGAWRMDDAESRREFTA